MTAFMSKDKSMVSWIGATMHDAYDYYFSHCDNPLSFEEFSKMSLCEMPDNDATHAVIRVRSPEKSIIDLTSSQVTMGPETVHLIFSGDELPQYGIDPRGIHIIYEKSKTQLLNYDPARFSGIVEDLLDAMDLAVACRLDRNLFMKTLSSFK